MTRLGYEDSASEIQYWCYFQPDFGSVAGTITDIEEDQLSRRHARQTEEEARLPCEHAEGLQSPKGCGNLLLGW